MKAPDHLARFPRVALPIPRLVFALIAVSPNGRGVPIDASLANFTSQLPVIVLDTRGTGALGANEADRAVRFDLFASAGAGPVKSGTFAVPPIVSADTWAHVRGSSSAQFPKKSYSLELLDDRGKSAKQPLLGLATDDTWKLISPWNYDRAFFRNAYVYALSRSLGRWAPRTKFVECFTRGDAAPLDTTSYAGISLLTERITFDRDHVNLAPLSANDVSGGYILKVDSAEAGDVTFTTPHLADWSPRSNLIVDRPGDLSAAQLDYIRDYVTSMENALYADAASGWATHRHLLYLDRASWVDYHLLQVLAGNIDAFQRSFFFTKDRGGKLVAGPQWDFDRALGSADPRSAAPDQWNRPDATDLWNYGWWGLLTRDPDFMQAWIDRWQSLRRQELSPDALAALADQLAAQIGPEAAARDAARWPDDASRFPDGWAGEVAQLKSWVSHRAAWIDAQFVAPPRLETDGALLAATVTGGAKLVYTLDGSDPRGPNGLLALNARIASGPLVVDATLLLCVRAWSPAPVVFPGSPWSAPLTRMDATAVRAETNPAFQSRLANLSSFVRLSRESSAPLMGLVITGDQEKSVLIRAIGPGLRQFGLTDTLTDPVLSLLDRHGAELARNTGWTLGADALDLPRLSASAGAFQLAADSADSALVLRLAPGSYTISVSSATGATGTALAEVYELDRLGSLASLSTFAPVSSSSPMLAGGFIVRGSTPRKFLVRASGPALAPWSVQGTAADPVLTIATASGLIARNDDWSTPADGAATVAATAAACGAFPFPAGGKDAALVVTLAPGAYTAQVTTKDGATGFVLLEVYGVP